jgi:hypothetical protein
MGFKKSEAFYPAGHFSGDIRFGTHPYFDTMFG